MEHGGAVGERGIVGITTTPSDKPRQASAGRGGAQHQRGGSRAGVAPKAPTSLRGPRGKFSLPARGCLSRGSCCAAPGRVVEGWGSPCRLGTAPGAGGRWAGNAGQGGRRRRPARC